MSFKSLLNKKCSWRRRYTAGINDFGEIIYSDLLVASDVRCSRQLGKGYNARQLVETRPGNVEADLVTYFILPTDIQEDDIITFEGSETEKVRSVKDPAGRGHHLEVLAEHIKETGEHDERIG